MATKTQSRRRSDAEILADIEADRDTPIGPPVDGATLRALGAAAKTRDDAEASVAAGIDAARAAGHSWAVIGAVLGVSRQAVVKRYGRR